MNRRSTNLTPRRILWERIGRECQRRRAALFGVRETLCAVCRDCPARTAGHCSGGGCSIYVALHGKGGLCDILRRLERPERYKVKLDHYTPETWAAFTTAE